MTAAPRSMPPTDFDAIVVGSGMTGGWAAKELTELGLWTLVLEAGRPITPEQDYVEHKPSWEMPFRGLGDRRATASRQSIQSHSVSFDEMSHVFWTDDVDNPYSTPADRSFYWFRARQVGGKSIIWGRQVYRMSDLDFEANLCEGIAVDWPIRYKDIAPWYDHVEKFAGISGSRDGLLQLPDGQFMPAMEMTCVEKDVAARLKDHYKGARAMIIGRTANITEPIQARSKCQFRNKCALGCPFGAYFSTQSSTLPAAMNTGKRTLRPFSIVTKIIYDKDTKKAKGVEVLDAETNQTYEFFSKIVFLNASTLNSTWLLMNSATDIWPDGLGSSSGVLGQNLMDHHLGVGAGGDVEGYEDKYYYGRRANGIYIPRYRNLFGDKRDYLRGFGYQGGGGREGFTHEVAEYSIGAEYKEALTEPGKWKMHIGGFGEILPYAENKVTLDKTRKDKWGLNILAIDCELKDNERKMRKDMLNDA